MEGNGGEQVFATLKNDNSQSILDAGSTVKSASKIKLELKRGSLKDSKIINPLPKVSEVTFYINMYLPKI